MPSSRRLYVYLRSNVIGLVAIFIALTGSAIAANGGAADGVPAGSITTEEIRNHDVTGADLGPDSVTSSKIAPGTIKGTDLNPDRLAFLQRRIETGCPPGESIREVAADGTVTCQGGGGVPSGPAGGELAGTYPDPDVNESSLDSTVLQSRVSGSCAAGNAIRTIAQDGTVTCQGTGTGTVTQVNTSGGLTGGPITTSGTITTDPTVLQNRVGGSCGGTTAVQSVTQAGGVTCSAALARSANVLATNFIEMTQGSPDQVLFQSTDIQVVAQCTATNAILNVRGVGTAVNVISRSGSVTAGQTVGANTLFPVATTTGNDLVTLTAAGISSPTQIQGIASAVKTGGAGSNCQFVGGGLAG